MRGHARIRCVWKRSICYRKTNRFKFQVAAADPVKDSHATVSECVWIELIAHTHVKRGRRSAPNVLLTYYTVHDKSADSRRLKRPACLRRHFASATLDAAHNTTFALCASAFCCELCCSWIIWKRKFNLIFVRLGALGTVLKHHSSNLLARCCSRSIAENSLLVVTSIILKLYDRYDPSNGSDQWARIWRCTEELRLKVVTGVLTWRIVDGQQMLLRQTFTDSITFRCQNYRSESTRLTRHSVQFTSSKARPWLTGQWREVTMMSHYQETTVQLNRRRPIRVTSRSPATQSVALTTSGLGGAWHTYHGGH